MRDPFSCASAASPAAPSTIPDRCTADRACAVAATLPDAARRTTRRRTLTALSLGTVAALAAFVSPAARAQLARSFPESARLGRFAMRVYPEAELDDEAVRLAAGAQIRDANHRIVMPSTLSGTFDVLVERDPSGQIGRVWILTPEERVAAEQRASAASRRTSQ